MTLPFSSADTAMRSATTLPPSPDPPPSPPIRTDPNSTSPFPPLSVSSSLRTQSASTSSRPLAAAAAAAAADYSHIPSPVDTTRTAAASSSLTSPYSDAAFSRAIPRPDEIEMDNIAPAGHRRRRSSLMNPTSPAAINPSATRPRSQSTKNPFHNPDDPRILEEGDERDSSSPEDSRPAAERNSLSDEDLHDDEETGLTSKDRRRKRQKKRRNTRLDQRIVREKITAEERQEADQNVLRKLVLNGVLICLWYFFSLCISLYNKWMFDKDRLNFPFPLFTTSMHMIVQFVLACITLYFIPSLRPQNGHRSDPSQSRHDSEPEKPLMTKMFYLTRIGPCGAATGLDIGLGNTSLKFITLTFYTMCKSSSLGFVLIFAFLFRLESPTWKLVGIIATMTAGVVMMVAGEVEFQLGGFVLVISAAFFSGFRWALTQILLLRNPATSNPFSSIFFLAPIMFVSLLVIAIPAEGFFELLDALNVLVQERGGLVAPLLIIFPGTLAFLMTAAEFTLLQRTSVVTLSIAGIFKEAVTISAAAVVFGDTLTAVNISGLLVTLGAIAAYNWIKVRQMRRDAQVEAHRNHFGDDDIAVATPTTPGIVDDEDDAAAEARGLLRDSLEVEQSVFTTDGDAIPRSDFAPETPKFDRETNRSERED